MRRRGQFSFTETDEFSSKIPVFEVHPLKALWKGSNRHIRVGTAEVGLTKIEDAWVRIRPSQDAVFGAIAKSEVQAELRDFLRRWRQLDDLRESFGHAWETTALTLWLCVNGGLLEAATEPLETETSTEASELSGHTLRIPEGELAALRDLAVQTNDPLIGGESLELRMEQDETPPDDPEERIHFDFERKMSLDHYA